MEHRKVLVLTVINFRKIDSLAQVGLWGDMMPGAQILVARKGKVIYNKNFGYKTQVEERML